MRATRLMTTLTKAFFLGATCFVALLILHCCSRFALSQIVADANRFPISLKTEAFLDRPTTARVSFKIIFPKDDERYVPVSAELAGLLSSPPDIKANPDLRVRAVNTQCFPEDIVAVAGATMVTLKGGIVNCDIEIAPSQSVKKGVYNIVLTFPTIDAAFDMIGSVESFPKAVAQIQVEVWPSPEAKEKALRAAEEERRRKEEAAAQVRREQEEAAAQVRRQKEEAEAKERRELRIELLKKSSPYLGVGLFLVIVVFLKRKWLWPDFKAYTTAGSNTQFNNVVSGRDGLEPGTILHTTWAKAWRGTRQRIKVETFVAESPSEHTHSKLDLLVSVGASVRPGVYMAIVPGCAVRVSVSKDALR